MIGISIVFALLTLTLASGSKSAGQKKAVEDTNRFVVSWADRSFALLLVLIPAVLYTGIPKLNLDKFLTAYAVSATISVTATYLIAVAYSKTDMSVVAPLFALSPLLTVVTSFFVNGEVPSPIGFLGVVLTVVGVYFIKNGDGSFWSPLKRLVTDKGALIVLFVILLYSVSAAYDKVGVQASSPVFWSAAVHAASAVTLLPFMMYKAESPIERVKENKTVLALFSVAGGIGSVAQMWALEQTLVTYVITVKRMSILVALGLGQMFLESEDITKRRAFGAVLMSLGAVAVTVFS